MAFSRRGVLGTLIGVPAALTAILSSKQAIGAEDYPRIVANGDLSALEHHPIFGFQRVNEQGQIYSLRVVPGAPRIGLRVTKEIPEPERFASLREAEDAAFAYIAQKLEFMSSPTRSENPLMTLRASTLIGNWTRRGLGNRVLVSEDDLDALIGTTAAFKAVTTPSDTQVDRWKHVGTLNDAVEVWTTRQPPDLLKNGRALVAYKNGSTGTKSETMDAGVILAHDHAGFGLHLNRPESQTLGEGRDFFCLLGLSRDEMEAAA